MQKAHKWTIQKWGYLKKYLHAYTTIVSCYFPKFIYIDLCAGKGIYDGNQGSPLIALNLEYPFTDYIFVEKDEENIAELKKNVSNVTPKKAVIYRNDDKKQKDTQIKISFKKMEAIYFVNQELEKIPSYPCFIFIDPDGIEEVDMDSIVKCGKKDRSELFINFSVSGVIRNIGNERCHPTITKFYGNEKWKNVKGVINKEERYAELYVESLKNFFNHQTYIKIKNENNVPLYYLIYTTNNDSGFKIMKDVLKQKDKQIKLQF